MFQVKLGMDLGILLGIGKYLPETLIPILESLAFAKMFWLLTNQLDHGPVGGLKGP